MSFKSWWNSLWEGNPNVYENGLPRLTETVPMPEVKPCKPEKDISEPVLSFLEVYKANPKRFKVFMLWSENENEYGKKEFLGYELKDTQANKTFSMTKEYTGHFRTRATERGMEDEYHWIYKYRAIKNTSWLTTDERELIFTTVESERTERAKNLLTKKEALMRKRLTKLYKGE